MPVKKFIKRIVEPPVEEVETEEEEGIEEDPDEVDPDDAMLPNDEEEGDEVDEGVEDEEPASVAPPKKVKKVVAKAKPVAKKAVAKKIVVKKVVAKAKVAAKPKKAAAKVAEKSSLIHIGGKTSIPTVTFELEVCDVTLDVPGEAPEALGGRISREAVENAVHTVLVDRNLVPSDTTKRATAEVLKAVEETIHAVVSQYNFKFMGGMFKRRTIAQRYYRPISDGRHGSLMPEHVRIKLDINVDGVKAIKGTANDAGEFIEAPPEKKKKSKK